ncbi:MAG: hypothetical protein K2H23_05230 [Oscillospiraceae bacterium]|nr:hypothetical protein [Oscillospiraceae bacterium]
MKLGEKVSYLKGLIEGLEIDENTKEGKVIAVMADILQDMALSAEDMQDQIDEIVEVVDTIDEDLGDLERDFYELDDDCCGDDDYDDCDCCGDDEDDMYEVVCPSCGDTICLNEGMVEEGSMTCPGCGELLEFDFDDEEEDE